MNINALYHHPAELEAEAMLSREQAYPDDFTLAELHDGFIADLNENGLPEMPAAH